MDQPRFKPGDVVRFDPDVFVDDGPFLVCGIAWFADRCDWWLWAWERDGLVLRSQAVFVEATP